MSPEQLEDLKRYVGFGDSEAEALRRFAPVAEPHFNAIVDDFYDTIEAHPGAVAVITGGKEQVERLKLTLKRWMRDVLTGPHDAGFLEAHSRIGRVHVRINLPQEFMFSAVNRIRTRLLALASEGTTEDDPTLRRAIDQILDLELAIMLDTYREDMTEKVRGAERLATLGQFSATIAHELRNPLGTVESSLFLIRRRLDQLNVADPTVDRHAGRIEAEVRQCGTTIDHLLDLARDRPLRAQKVAASTLIADAVASVPVPAHVTLVQEVPDGIQIEGDANQLRQAVGNLIRNGIEAITRSGEVRLRVAQTDGQTEIDVVDDGDGVPADIRARIFDVLFTTKPSGTGLGLALAKRVAEAHGGSLQLLPAARGAHFRLRLPRPK